MCATTLRPWSSWNLWNGQHHAILMPGLGGAGPALARPQSRPLKENCKKVNRIGGGGGGGGNYPPAPSDAMAPRQTSPNRDPNPKRFPTGPLSQVSLSPPPLYPFIACPRGDPSDRRASFVVLLPVEEFQPVFGRLQHLCRGGQRRQQIRNEGGNSYFNQQRVKAHPTWVKLP